MDINDGEWPLPPAGPQDEAMSERLMATGGRFSPGRQWNIDCMVRVIAPVLDEYGLLDGPAPWLEMRSSRSEMAGGLTVEFGQHPDEADPRFRKLTHFRFRPQRRTKSGEALADLRAASVRRAFLMRRRSAIDSGATTEGRALLCDAVLPGLLELAGIDATLLADHVADDHHLLVNESQNLGKTGFEPIPVDLERRGQELIAHRITLPGGMIYRSAHGSPSLVVRSLTFSDDEIGAMVGRPLHRVLPRDGFDVDGLDVTAAACRGDTTIFTLSRPQATLFPLPH